MYFSAPRTSCSRAGVIVASAACSSLLMLAACSREAASARSALSPEATTTAAPVSAATRGYRIFVTNEMSGDLSVIDAATHTVVATVPLGKRPRGLRASVDGKTLYVALSGSPVAGPGVEESKLPPPDKGADGIGVIDLETLTMTRILRGFSDPERIALSPDDKLLYVASEDTGNAIIADAADGKVHATVAVGGEPEGIAVTKDGRFVYVSSEATNQVAVIDADTHEPVTRFDTGQRPRDIAFSADGAWAWVTGENDASLTVVSTKTHTRAGTITIPGENARPMGVTTSPDGSRIFVSTGRGGTVVAVNAATGAILGSVAVGPRPWGLALSPDGDFLYTANGSSNDVTVVDAHTLNVAGKIKVGQRPWDVVTVAAGVASKPHSQSY